MGMVDIWIVYRFIRMLTTPWDETDAFKQGVLDADGTLLVKVNKMNDKQKPTYTLFHRLVYNIKRLVEKVPGGKSKLGTYAAALYLLRENMGDSEGIIVMERVLMSYLKENDALEDDFLAEQYLPEEMLEKGNYKIVNTMIDMKGNHIPKNTLVIAKRSLKPVTRVLGVDVFQLQVLHTGKDIIVSREDIVADHIKEDEGGAPTNNMGGGNIAGVDFLLFGGKKKADIVGPEPSSPEDFREKIFRRPPPSQ